LVLALGIYIYAAAYPDPATVEKQIFQGLNGTIHKYGGNMTGVKNITYEWDALQENVSYINLTILKPPCFVDLIKF